MASSLDGLAQQTIGARILSRGSPLVNASVHPLKEIIDICEQQKRIENDIDDLEGD
jgi:hypothetical protein